jgi:cell wall assembly regulator SMI1
MTRARKFLIIVFGVLVIVVIVLALAGRAIQQSFFYPKPRSLPQGVGLTTEQLLTRLQTVLETKAPTVARSLQAGLSDTQISALEAQGDFHLSGDIKSLYRWHNGMSSNSPCGLLPGQRFLPLDELVRQRTLMRQQSASATLVQRAAFSIFTGYMKSWVHLLDDGAGDGYFYDPERTDAEGAFFYHMAEERYYLWFPSLQNFLSDTIECYDSGAFKVTPDGKGLSEDSPKAQKIWGRLAKSSESGT